MPVRVALVNHTARLGGGEVALLQLVTCFDPAVVRPVVVLGEDGPFAARLRDVGIEVALCRVDPRLGDRRKETLSVGGLLEPAALRLAGRSVLELSRLFRRLGVRVVHTNSLKAHVLGGLAGRLAGVPVIWHVRDHIAPPYLPAAAAAAVRISARCLPHAVFTVSRSAARALGRRDAIILRQAVPLPELNGYRRPDGRLRVGLVGRIAPWKGQDVFIDAAGRLVTEFPEVEFVLAGAALFGEYAFEALIRRRAAEPGLAGRVRFLGFRDDLSEVYRELDVAVHASTMAEPYGNVILEAMAHRVPIVASRAGGALELVDEGRNGLLVQPGDPAALADVLRRLLRDPAERRRLALAGREHVETHFSLRRDAETVERVYARLTAFS